MQNVANNAHPFTLTRVRTETVAEPVAESLNDAGINVGVRQSFETVQNNPKGMPVDRWPFYFDGEGEATKPMHGSGGQPKNRRRCNDVNEFLMRVEESASSESLTEQQVLSKLHFLLEGNAKNWYRVSRQEIDTWYKFIGDSLKTIT